MMELWGFRGLRLVEKLTCSMVSSEWVGTALAGARTQGVCGVWRALSSGGSAGSCNKRNLLWNDAPMMWVGLVGFGDYVHMAHGCILWPSPLPALSAQQFIYIRLPIHI